MIPIAISVILALILIALIITSYVVIKRIETSARNQVEIHDLLQTMAENQVKTYELLKSKTTLK